MPKRISFICVLLLYLVCCPFAAAQGYERSLNDGWTFRMENGAAAQAVSFPHTWNAEDAVDDDPGYWRGAGWYERTVRIHDELSGKKVIVRFEGANQEADLYVNGVHAGNHKGGYTAFVFDVSSLVHAGDNAFRIRVDNSHNDGIPPVGADFTFFGGIYRDVSLLFLPENHISVEHFASDGVYITTPMVAAEKASVQIETHLSIGRPEKKLLLEHVVLDPDGKQVAAVRQTVKKPSASQIVKAEVTVPAPRLWDVDSPELYTVVTRLLDKKGTLADSRRNTFGIRTFRFDPEKGFFLNGRQLKLIGTNRHQDFPGKGNAIPDEMHLRDVRLLKEMGGNFLRISHYPQDPLVSAECDRLGILACMEIPVVNRIGFAPDFTDNCVKMAREMVHQYFNHPSIVAWAYMNEVLLDLSPVESGEVAKEAYYSQVKACAATIDAAIREADPSRPTMIPCDSERKKYKECGIGDIPDILAFNVYFGWYYGQFASLSPGLDKLHATFPGKALFISEYGADADTRLHSFEPECGDYTCDYALLFHKNYFPVLQEKEYLAGATVWNLNDFHSETRGYAVPHFNCKGITTADRTPKDSYWMYKALLSKEPFLRIGGADWIIRGGQETGGACVQPVEIFATARSVELSLNGKSLGSRAVKDGCAQFEVPFKDGENVLEARGSDGAADLQRVDFRLVPEDLSKFREMSVLMGTRRYFEDRAGGQIWIPEQEYKPGSWGHVGGKRWFRKSGSHLRPAAKADIVGTELDPLFQTQRDSLQSFRADVPDGSYYVYLYLAELSSEEDERVFSVAINETTVLKELNMAAEYGRNTAVIERFPVDIEGGKGLRVDFIPSKGAPVLNAIRILKVK